MEKFEYTYSAPQQAEIEKIRKKYAPATSTEFKIQTVMKLNKSVENTAIAVSLAVGIIGALVLGTGMCCVMLWELFIIGIVAGIIGMAIFGYAYPLYKKVIREKREKIAPQILKLTEEIEHST